MTHDDVGAGPCACPSCACPNEHPTVNAALQALSAVLAGDNGAAFQLLRQCNPMQLQDIGNACDQLHRIAEGVFWAEHYSQGVTGSPHGVSP
jgi:hypothetical protein